MAKKLNNAEYAALLLKQHEDKAKAETQKPEPVIPVVTPTMPEKAPEPFCPTPETAETIKKKIEATESYLTSHRSVLTGAVRKAERQKISDLKKQLRNATSVAEKQRKAALRQEKLAKKLGEKEARRLQSQHSRILNALKEKDRETSELAAIASRYGARIGELIKDGWEITKTPQFDGQFLYHLDVAKSTAVTQ